MLSFHRCIAPTVDSSGDTYLDNLDLRKRQRDLLANARPLVREALRAAFKKATAGFTGDERPISCNFFTQGSWAYKTINRPAYIPPQQNDMDDGCYLPMSFVRGKNPKRAASWYFEIADRALEELVAAQGWKGCDHTKPTCCRVIIDNESHLDVPLYAIQDEKFVLMKSVGQERAGRVLKESVLDENEYPFDWSMVSDEDVLLANRDGRWVPSNPMDVCNWVKSAVDAQSEQLRQTWRSIKGWRDHAFPAGGGASSICLMVMVQPDFRELPWRNDLALMGAAKSVRQRVLGRVEAPWGGEDLNRLSIEERREVGRKAQALEEEIAECIQGTMDKAALFIRRLREKLGPHFSGDASRVAEVEPMEVVRAYSVAPAVIPRFRGDNRSA